MTRVKICGLTRFEDARLAVDLGAHALGLVFETSSRRYAGNDADLLSRLAELGPYVTRVAVFGDGVRGVEGFDAVQGFGPRPQVRRFIEAFPIAGGAKIEEVLARIASSTADAILLDAHHPTLSGGTGLTVDWGLAAEVVAACACPIILAGGLSPENVGDAVRRVRPYAVDVSSGVEVEIGIKDAEKVRRFIAEALQA